MKINFSTDKPSGSNKKKSLSNEKTEFIKRTDEEGNFLEILESIIPSSQDDTRELNVLWANLPGIEKNLINTPSIENLNSYKNHIKSILDKILQKNVKLETARRRNRDDQKILVTIKIIDDKLQLLARTIVNGNNTAFDILKRTQDIRGLILDFKN